MNVHDQDSPSGHSVEQHDISRDDTPGNPPILPAKDHGVPAPHRPWVQDISNMRLRKVDSSLIQMVGAALNSARAERADGLTVLPSPTMNQSWPCCSSR
jgi:hypothetical protein